MAFNTKCGLLKPGTKCTWLADNGSREEPIKIQIEAGGGGLPDGMVKVKVWEEVLFGVKEYACGYEKSMVIDRRHVCGGQDVFLQPLPDGLACHEQCIALRQLGTKLYPQLCKLLKRALSDWLAAGGFPASAARLICPPIKGLDSMVRKVMSKYKGTCCVFVCAIRFCTYARSYTLIHAHTRSHTRAHVCVCVCVCV